MPVWRRKRNAFVLHELRCSCGSLGELAAYRGISIRVPLALPDGGEMPEWLKGTDCKSVGDAYGGSNPSLPTIKSLS
jgi:hypothetical protein